MNTMKEVAELAGVSMMTVSRVISGQSKVREATRVKVMEAIDKLDYRPNLSARSLARSKSLFIGLFSTVPNSDYLGQILIGVLAEGRKLGYYIVLDSPVGNEKNWAEEVIEFCKASRLGGVILPPPLCDDKSVLRALQQSGTPVVRISAGDHKEHAATVRIDDYQAMYDMTDYLINCGHQRIAFMMGADNQLSSHARLAGFQDAMKDSGLFVPDEWVQGGDYDFPSALSTALEILKSSKGMPTAIVASNDDMAAAAYTAANQLGISIPDQLSVTGFDDTPRASTMFPTLTTVRQPITQMATRAVDLLVDNGNANKEEDNIFEYEIIKRDSVRSINFPDLEKRK